MSQSAGEFSLRVIYISSIRPVSGPPDPKTWRCSHFFFFFSFRIFFIDFFEISNGHNWGAIWSNRDETLSCDTAMTSSCSGQGSQGAWGLGRWEKVEKCFLRANFFELVRKVSNKKKKIFSDVNDLDTIYNYLNYNNPYLKKKLKNIELFNKKMIKSQIMGYKFLAIYEKK